MNRIALRFVPFGLVLAVVAVIPTAGRAQPVGPYPKKPAAVEKGAKGDFQVSIVTLGTPKDVVDSYLGTPRSGWTINSLCRSMYTYRDGTKIIFVDGRAISACPNGLAQGGPDQGFIVEREGRKVFFEPIVLKGVPLDGPHGELKHQVEASFPFSQPGYIPPPADPLPWIGQSHFNFWRTRSNCRPIDVER